jgi:hypothetical protein
MTIDMRALGACVFACAVATATLAPAETDWDALDSKGWGATATQGGARAAQQSDASGRVAQSSTPSGGTGDGIKQAFVKLGMAEERAACYQDVLAQQLSPEEQQRAAELVSESEDASAVKTNIISAGPTMVGGFSAADASCPEGMGS